MPTPKPPTTALSRKAPTPIRPAASSCGTCPHPGKYRLLARSPFSSDGTSYKSEPKGVTLSQNDHKTLSVKLIKPQD